MTYEYPSYNLKKKEKSRIKKPMTWKELLVKANFTEGDGRKNLYHFLPEGVSLKDELLHDPCEVLEGLRRIVSIYEEIETIEESIRVKYPNRCLSCNAQGGKWRFYEECGRIFSSVPKGEFTSYFDSCSDCVNQGLDPCNTNLKLVLSVSLREWDNVWGRPHTSIEEVDVDNLHYALSPTTGKTVSSHEWPNRGELKSLRRRIQGIIINVTCPKLFDRAPF